MSRRNGLYLIGILVLMGITSAVTVLAYTYIIGGSGEASAPISAPTLSLDTPTAHPLEAQVAELSTRVAQLQADNATLAAGGAGGAPQAETSPAAEVTQAADTSAQTASEATLYRIVPDESEVRFILTEDLRGVPTTVTAVSNQVAGDVVVDFAAPANSRIGVIRINARTLITDNEFRNRAIRAEILESTRDEYEYIDFTPTAISGLPDSVAVGQEISFQVTGDLKIRTITQPVTFEVTAVAVSEERLEGSARAQVTRGQYNLVIPSAPGVANVSEDVRLELDFVAARVTQ